MNTKASSELLVILGIIKKRRMDLGYSQKVMGDLVGCNQSQYSKKENGKQQFTVDEFLKLIECLRLTDSLHLKNKERLKKVETLWKIN